MLDSLGFFLGLMSIVLGTAICGVVMVFIIEKQRDYEKKKAKKEQLLKKQKEYEEKCKNRIK
jgi:hypothetical protein